MKKRFLLASLMLGLSAVSLAQLKYVEGPDKDYQPTPSVLDQAQAPKVIEFFWYGCPHCYHMYEPMQNWIGKDKPADLRVEEVPAMFSPQWAVGGHLYYTAKALGLDVDQKIFDEFHQKHNRRLVLDPEAAKAFLVSQGVDKAKVEKTWNSAVVKQNMERAQQLLLASGIKGVPAFIVNGSYEAPFDGHYQAFFQKLDALARTLPPRQP